MKNEELQASFALASGCHSPSHSGSYSQFLILRASCFICLGSLCVLCVSAVNFAQAADPLPPGWTLLAPKNAGFSIAMPGTPRAQKRNITTKEGAKSELMTYALGTRFGTFNLGYSESKDGANVKPDQLFDRMRDQMAKPVKGTVLEEKGADVNNHPGREVLIETDKKVCIRVRFVLVDDRLYTISVTGAREWATGKEADRFFESFKVVEKN
jgi:hypothetical protein